MTNARKCEWCGGPLRPEAKSTALTCSKPCRQAKARFRVSRGPSGTDKPMRFAYADPPYPGRAQRYYGMPEVDHAALIGRLCAGFPDGWALSTAADKLQAVLAFCPPGVRVCAWNRGHARRVRVLRWQSTWEPVIVAGGRRHEVPVVEDLGDVLTLSGNARSRSHPGAIVGMKPAGFCEWVFRLLGARRGDELIDVFPGSGAVGRAWQLFQGHGLVAATESLLGSEESLLGSEESLLGSEEKTLDSAAEAGIISAD